MKIMTVVGARPEFIQTAPVSKAIREFRLTEVLVHTGQHYDAALSDVFFADLNLPAPDVNLGVGSGSHARQTGQMMIALEPVMLDHAPDMVLVYGDTNSTVAAALTAAKLCIPLAHIEAGLRSFDRTMPEEINRITTDHLSDILFAPTRTAVRNLMREGLAGHVQQVGDVRVDVTLGLVPQARSRLPRLRMACHLEADEPFALATIHRAANTDSPATLQGIINGFDAFELPVVLPVHPRLRKMMRAYGLRFSGNVRAVDPVGYLDMLALLDGCAVVLTDSGGLQKEAYMLRRPTVTIRDSTEWVETVEAGWNRLCAPSVEAIQAAGRTALAPPPTDHPDFYGTAGVSARICAELEAFYARRPRLEEVR